jgi:CheY-like chemotaxis protein
MAPVQPVIPSVLLVEPDIDSRDMYAGYLRRAGFRSVAVDSVAAALPHLHRVDAIVTGIRLQGDVDGISLIGQLRQDPQTRVVPIVVVSACAWKEERERAMQAGCDSFLSKPCLPGELLAELRRLLPASRLAAVRGKTAVAKVDLAKQPSEELRSRKPKKKK